MRRDQREQVQGQAAVADTTRRWTGLLGLALAVGVTYFVGAWLSLGLVTVPDGVAVFWPAAGISSGILIALGRGARLSVTIGTMAATIAANLLGDRNLLASVSFAVCNAAEALIIAGLIERYVGANFTLDRLRHVLGFLLAAVAGTAVSGTAATAAYKLFHSPTAPVLTIWQHWLASDAVGVVAVAPLVIGLTAALPRPLPRSEFIEGGAVCSSRSDAMPFAVIAVSGCFISWEIAAAVAARLISLLLRSCSSIAFERARRASLSLRSANNAAST